MADNPDIARKVIQRPTASVAELAGDVQTLTDLIKQLKARGQSTPAAQANFDRIAACAAKIAAKLTPLVEVQSASPPKVG